MGIFKRSADGNGNNVGSTAISTPVDGMDPNLPPLPTDFASLVEFAGHHIQAQQVAHSSTWGLGSAERFDVDLEAGTITWQFPDKNVVANAPAELLGTWNPQDNTFLWGWDHPSTPPGTAIATQAVKTWADQNGVVELQQRSISCTNDECYSIAGIASPIGNLQGVYRFDAGGPWAYVGFGNVTLSPAHPS